MKRSVFCYEGLITAFFLDGREDQGLEFIQGNGDLILLAIDAIGDLAKFLFLVADDEGEGDLVHLRVAEAIPQLFVRIVKQDADTKILQFLFDLLRVIAMDFGVDRKQGDLGRGKPGREGATIVFDQDAKEALDRAEDDAVKHDRFDFLAVFIDIEAAEAVREVDV